MDCNWAVACGVGHVPVIKVVEGALGAGRGTLWVMEVATQHNGSKLTAATLLGRWPLQHDDARLLLRLPPITDPTGAASTTRGGGHGGDGAAVRWVAAPRGNSSVLLVKFSGSGAAPGGAQFALSMRCVPLASPPRGCTDRRASNFVSGAPGSPPQAHGLMKHVYK